MNKFQIVVDNHKCSLDLNTCLATLKSGRYTLEILSADDKTLNQMRLYRGSLIGCLKDYTGYSHEECNSLLKAKFLDIETINIEGTEYKILPSLENITKVKFSKFIDNVIEYLADLGLNPPTYKEHQNA